MKKLWDGLAAMAMTFVMGSTVYASNGELTVKDPAKLFTADGIKAAKDEFAKTKYDSPTKIMVVTFDGLPNKRKSDFEKVKNVKADRDRFVGEWAREEAKANGAEGIFILVATNPNQIRIVDDEQMRVDRKFGEAKVSRMQELLIDAFKASKDLTGDVAKQGHDVGLLKAVEYAGEQLKGTAAIERSTSGARSKVKTDTGEKAMGSNLLGWVCLIGVVLLGVWLVVGVIRALTGGMGGGGYGGGMGGGGYGGGGGGGFMSSLFGGMFGSMAGMWMYNNFFGGGMNSMSAGDYGAGSGGGYGGDTSGGDAGGQAGNFDNGADAGGGDWGDSGGASDYSGGGDFGGGDFGGGGGDFGGGGGGDW